MKENTYNACIMKPIGFLSKLYIHFAVIDSCESLHKPVFKKHGIKFIPTISLDDNTKEYKIFRGFILFPNYDNIQNALVELEKNVLICGHTTYDDVCEETCQLLLAPIRFLERKG